MIIIIIMEVEESKKNPIIIETTPTPTPDGEPILDFF